MVYIYTYGFVFARFQMSKFKKNESLNFLWVGKPRSESGKPLGSDLEHVVKMAKKADNPVSFYCLGEHENEYKKILQKNGVKNVTVVSMDKYLDKIANGKSQFSEQAAKMQDMRNELLIPPRNRIIDIVAFKDAFSVFLLATKGGYTLDTNIQLDSTDKKFKFPKNKEFLFPKGFGNVAEVWMMYAPKKSQEAADVLNNYLKKWDKAQDIIRNNLKNPPAVYDYHRKITSLITDSVAIDKEDAYWKNVDWKYELSEDGRVATMPSLPILKNYGNSHKPHFEIQEILTQNIDNYIKEKNEGSSSLAKTIQGLVTKIDTMIINQVDRVPVEVAQVIVNNLIKFSEILDEIEDDFSENKNVSKNLSSDFIKNLKDARQEIEEYAQKLIDTPLTKMPEYADNYKSKFDNVINDLRDFEKKANKQQKEQGISNFKDFKKEVQKIRSEPKIEEEIKKNSSEDLSTDFSI